MFVTSGSYYEGQRGEVSFVFTGRMTESEFPERAQLAREMLVLVMQRYLAWQKIPFGR